jgi:hypothetical protein
VLIQQRQYFADGKAAAGMAGLRLMDGGQNLPAKLVAKRFQLLLPLHGKFHFELLLLYTVPQRGLECFGNYWLFFSLYICFLPISTAEYVIRVTKSYKNAKNQA